MKFALLLKITIYRFDLKKMVIPGNNEVSTFTLVIKIKIKIKINIKIYSGIKIN